MELEWLGSGRCFTVRCGRHLSNCIFLVLLFRLASLVALSDGLFRMPAVSPIFLRRGCLAAKLAATAIVLPTHVQATIANGVLSVEGEQAF